MMRRSARPTKRSEYAAQPIDRVQRDRVDAQLNVRCAGGFELSELVGQFVRRSDERLDGFFVDVVAHESTRATLETDMHRSCCIDIVDGSTSGQNQPIDPSFLAGEACPHCGDPYVPKGP
jgi:hypothetical protein